MSDEQRDLSELPLLSSSDLSLQLDRQRKHAKALRDAVRAGDATAVARVEKNHPRPRRLDLSALKLTDAQCVVAREAGLPSWPALKAHVDQIEKARTAIDTQAPAPDADLPTLHVRCGNDIETALTRAGFSGDFLMFADPICQGPVSEGPNALATRAHFIATEYPGEDETQTFKKLQQAEEKLDQAGQYGRIALWFEHDPYDQLLLIKALTRLKHAGANRRKIELISLDRFPGIGKFIGIGQLSPAALRHQYDKRQTVSETAYMDAERAWQAFLADTPVPLFAFSRQAGTALPFLPDAICRYLEELPSMKNGLSFTENAILGILKDEPLPWGRVFGRFMREVDPLPYHGDLMFLGTMLRLRDAAIPAVTSDPADIGTAEWGKAEFALTNAGEQLLNGKLDWKDCGPRQRFNGGVTCFAPPDWRWDAEQRRPVEVGQD